jgi:hypothetical protein
MIIRWDSPIRLLKAIVGTVRYAWDGFPVIAPESVRKEREDICRACPWALDSQCTLCTCFIHIKVALASESCPSTPKKWKKLTFSGPPLKDSNQS